MSLCGPRAGAMSSRDRCCRTTVSTSCFGPTPARTTVSYLILKNATSWHSCTATGLSPVRCSRDQHLECLTRLRGEFGSCRGPPRPWYGDNTPKEQQHENTATREPSYRHLSLFASLLPTDL